MRAPAGAVEHLDIKITMHNQAIAGAELAEEVERLMITAHQDMLAIIDEILAFGIGKGIGAAAEDRLTFQQRDAKAALGERHPGAQTSEATANDNDVAGGNR